MDKYKILEVLVCVLGSCIFVFYYVLLKFDLNFFKIRIAGANFNFEYQNNSIKDEVNLLEDFIPKIAETPVRSVIVSSWRSGSTFLGDMLNAVPSNYYHYEPLLPYGITQVRGPPNDTQALSDVTKLLKCDYSNMTNFFEFSKKKYDMLSPNWRVWKVCKQNSTFCYRSRFLGQICKLFPLQSMKLVRMRLNVAKELLKDASLNVRILFLVRDPRAVLQSRKHETWCPGVLDCGSDDPQILCADMVSDYQQAINLTKNYPLTFKAIRYEDFSLSTFEVAKEIFQFYGLPFEGHVEKFLQSHTKQSDGKKYSTYKDSKSTPFKWMKQLAFEEIDKIQKSCRYAMKLWGYKKMTLLDDKETFCPLGNFSGFRS